MFASLAELSTTLKKEFYSCKILLSKQLYALFKFTICDRACKNQPCEHKKLPIFSVFAVS